MAAGLNKGGFDSNRNLDKPFRTQTLDRKTGKVVARDAMFNGGLGGQNTTGCFGNKSSFSVRAKVYGPKRGKRRESQQKSGCRLYSTGQIVRWQEAGKDQILALRGQILTLKCIESVLGHCILTPEMNNCLAVIKGWVAKNLSGQEIHSMYERDLHREKCIEGQYKHGGIKKVYIREIQARAAMYLKMAVLK